MDHQRYSLAGNERRRLGSRPRKDRPNSSDSPRTNREEGSHNISRAQIQIRNRQPHEYDDI